MLKRSVDIVLSVSAIVVLSPVLVLIALLIRLDSLGPALFVQSRIGLNREPFRIFKFRSMEHRDPDKIDHNTEGVLTSGGDPRITRVGRLLRRTSLDELPQLINILKGDMSIVGPRPMLAEQVELVPRKYFCRFDVRPGLTGLAQVQGRRSLGWLEQLAADAEYVRKSGWWCDLSIIARTVWVVLRGAGIYGGQGRNWREYRDQLRAQRSNREQ